MAKSAPGGRAGLANAHPGCGTQDKRRVSPKARPPQYATVFDLRPGRTVLLDTPKISCNNVSSMPHDHIGPSYKSTNFSGRTGFCIRRSQTSPNSRELNSQNLHTTIGKNRAFLRRFLGLSFSLRFLRFLLFQICLVAALPLWKSVVKNFKYFWLGLCGRVRQELGEILPLVLGHFPVGLDKLIRPG